MDEKVCQRCKCSSLWMKDIQYLVNVCGHTLCELCVEVWFFVELRPCPICRVPLRRNNYRVQLFEDFMVDKEVYIRRLLLYYYYYNKKEEDFDTLDQYNDYLEEIEKIVYNLCNNIDVLDTNKRIEAYKRANRDLKEHKELLEVEGVKELEPLKEIQSAPIMQAKDEFIDHVMTGSGNTNEHIEHSNVHFITNGPAEPTIQEIQRIGYTKRMPTTEYERAGGYNVALSCKKMLHDAFQALYGPVVTKP